LARSAKTDEGCWTECGNAKLEHPSSDRASLGHLLPQGEKERTARNLGALSATLEIGEILCEGVRSMSGSANPKRLPCGMNGPVLLMTSMHAMFGPYPPPFFSIG
jgi:hypothetical protein